MTGNIIGVFILGILAGWLMEWLFITFIMAKNKPQTPFQPEKEKSTNDTVVKKEVIAEPTPVPTSSNEIEIVEIATSKKEQQELQLEKPASIEEDQIIEESKPIQQDDFIRLKGIGPKLAESIKNANINRYEELAAFTGEELIVKLETAGAIIVNRPAFAHIPKQAALAAKGDWDGLETLKKSI